MSDPTHIYSDKHTEARIESNWLVVLAYDLSGQVMSRRYIPIKNIGAAICKVEVTPSV